MYKNLYGKIKTFKVFVVLIFLCGVGNIVHAGQNNYVRLIMSEVFQAKTLTLTMTNKPIKDILKEIQKVTGLNFVYNERELSSYTQKSINVKNETIDNVLNQLLKGTELTYTLTGNSITIVKRPQSNTQPGKMVAVSGTLINQETGDPIFGATVAIIGTNKGTVTDNHGHFNIMVTPGQVMQFSFVGFQNTTKTVTQQSDRMVVNLKPESVVVDDVVVVGYGTTKKKDLTGSITSIGSDELNRVAASSTIQGALQGRIAGVSTQISSSSPTSPISVIIRGQSSLSGNNQPLWVIDGVPDYSGTTSGSVSNVLYSLNLNDVDNITILRDASATAIYGSRASNGVVLVTTKSGQRNMKPEISFSASVGFQKDNYNGLRYFEADEYIKFTRAAVAHEIETMGGLDYFTRLYADEAYLKTFMTSEIDRKLYRDLPNVFYDSNTNWQKEVGQTPINQNYDISVRGGSENFSYYVSLFYKGYKGVVKTGFSDTYGGNLALESKISDRLKFGLGVRGSSRKTNTRDDLMNVIRQIRPDIPVRNPDGSYFRKDYYTENPLALLDNTNKGIGNNAAISPYLEWEVLRGLRLRTAPSINYNEAKSLSFTRSSAYENTVTDASRRFANTESTTYVWDNTLTLNKSIRKHDILAIAGFSLEKGSSLAYSMQASKFPDDDVLNSFPNATTKNSMGESYSENRLLSYFGRVQYKYSDAYLLTATFRRDGSSKFGANKRWGTFPSMGLGWIITEENFMKPWVKTISYLKFRASVGKTGSQNLGNYGYYATTSGGSYNDNPATTPSSMANSELCWEESLMYDLGIDYGFLDDRLRGTVGWYRRNTSSLIYSMPTPTSTSYSKVTANIAETSNEGLEFELKYDLIRDRRQQMTIDLNVSSGINKIEKFDGRMEAMYYTYNNDPATANMRTLAGGRINQWWGPRYLRLFDTAEEVRALEREDETGSKIAYNHAGRTFVRDGDLWLEDVNNDGKIDVKDYVDLGSADPKFYGGFGLNYIRGGLNVSANFTYAVGHKRYWALTDRSLQTGHYNQTNKIAGNSYAYRGADALFPSATPYDYQANNKFNSAYLYNASYLRLNDITVNYRLPARWFSGSLISSLEFICQATNLFTLTRYPGMDPQGNWNSTSIGTGMGIDSGIYPSSRIYTFGIKLILK